MPARTLTDAAAVPAALTAFLRGVERRGAVFAQLQCGDAERADDALAAAMRAFRNGATQVPVAEWPRRFWALLLTAPPLREQAHAMHWPLAFSSLARLGHGPRAALLLRLVAGLPDIEAAAVLGIARPTYRLALQRALPHDAEGRPDEAAWHALGEAGQQAIREMPAERLAHLARLREAAILGRRLDPRSVPASEATKPARPRWWWPALAGTAALSLIALSATFLVPVGDDGDAADARIRSRPLPPAEPPAATYDADTALLTHRDFEFLAIEAVSEAARDPAFYAWLSARAEASPGTGMTRSPPSRETTLPADAKQAPETSDAP
jgi:hypothetical protein